MCGRVGLGIVGGTKMWDCYVRGERMVVAYE